MQGVADRVCRERQLPSLAVGIVEHGCITAVVTGRREARGRDAAELSDVYLLGSLTKSLTATAAARCVERGEIAWTTTISQLFPDLPMRPEYRDITLDKLLSHHSGLPANYPGDPKMEGFLEDQEPTAERKEAFLKAILALPPATDGKFLYSNLGYAVAARMLEHVTGKTWPRILRDEVYTPLGMTSAGFGFRWPSWSSQPSPHVWTGEGPLALPPTRGNPRYLDGADNARCSIEDLARFARAHLGDAGSYLSPTSLEELHRDRGDTYGYGWFVGKVKGDTVLFHNGTNTMNYALILAKPSAHWAVVVTTNVGMDAKMSFEKSERAALQVCRELEQIRVLREGAEGP